MPCYWTTGFVNFNNKPYGYRNGTWIAIEATIIIPTKNLADSFRYEEVRHLQYEPQANPSYANRITSHMEIMADIAAAINEQTSTNKSKHHPAQTTNILTNMTDRVGLSTFSTWFENFKIFIFIICIILILFVICRPCYATGLYQA